MLLSGHLRNNLSIAQNGQFTSNYPKTFSAELLKKAQFWNVHLWDSKVCNIIGVFTFSARCDFNIIWKPCTRFTTVLIFHFFLLNFRSGWHKNRISYLCGSFNLKSLLAFLNWYVQCVWKKQKPGQQNIVLGSREEMENVWYICSLCDSNREMNTSFHPHNDPCYTITVLMKKFRLSEIIKTVYRRAEMYCHTCLSLCLFVLKGMTRELK